MLLFSVSSALTAVLSGSDTGAIKFQLLGLYENPVGKKKENKTSWDFSSVFLLMYE